MPQSRVVIENRTSMPMHFHVEPECIAFEIPVGKSAEINGQYQSEPITIQFTDDDEYGNFGAVYPGDGDIAITIDGRNILDV